jgi:hypothetical protein
MCPSGAADEPDLAVQERSIASLCRSEFVASIDEESENREKMPFNEFYGEAQY